MLVIAGRAGNFSSSLGEKDAVGAGVGSSTGKSVGAGAEEQGRKVDGGSGRIGKGELGVGVTVE